jgi:hypothetical protein
MTDHISELLVNAIQEAYEEFRAQTIITENASKLVYNLLETDNIRPFISIFSDAGRAEIDYNIQKAALLQIADYYTDIQIWAPKYIALINPEESNKYKTFRELYTEVNKAHLDTIIKDYTFECKCSDGIIHSYTFGDEICCMGTKVALVNIDTAQDTLGYIQYDYPYGIYPIEI